MKKAVVSVILVGLFCLSGAVYAQEFKKMEKDLKKMQKELTLTDKQVSEIRAIMEDKRAQRIDAAQMEKEGASKGLIRGKLDKINYEEKQEITAVLTEKQKRVRELLKKEGSKKAKQEELLNKKQKEAKNVR